MSDLAPRRLFTFGSSREGVYWKEALVRKGVLVFFLDKNMRA